MNHRILLNERQAETIYGKKLKSKIITLFTEIDGQIYRVSKTITPEMEKSYLNMHKKIIGECFSEIGEALQYIG